MGFILFAAFVGIPLIEIAVFIAVGQNIGLWPTLGLILLTAAVGSGMLRAQGLSTLFRAQQSARQGQLPITELFEGMYLLIAGVCSSPPDLSPTRSASCFSSLEFAVGWVNGCSARSAIAGGSMWLEEIQIMVPIAVADP